MTDVLLDRQLRLVADTSPYYRRLFGPIGVQRLSADDLPHLPFTTRADLVREQSEHPPFGGYCITGRDGIARVHRTSGTSGRALLIALSAADAADSVAAGAACFRSAGVRSDDLIAHCLNYCMWSGGVTDHEALERAGAGVIPFGVGDTTGLLQTLRHLRATGIHCTPSYLSKLEQRLQDEFGLAPRDLRLRIGLFGGEPGLQDEAFRARIESTWGITAVDANYGMSEVLSMFGAECAARDGLHFHADEWLHAELIDPGTLAPLTWEPGLRGELVLTHRRRECQPLIRYRTSDVIEVVGRGACRCGLTSPRFRVVGRTDDMLVVRGINVYLGTVARLVREMPEALTGEFRLCVNRSQPFDNCLIRAEYRDAVAPRAAAARLEQRLAAALNLRIPVELVPAGSLPGGEMKSPRLERCL